MRTLLTLCALFLTCSALHAEDWTTTDGKVYKGVKVLSSDATSVTILDSDGGASVALASLSSDLQKRFNYVSKAGAGPASASNDTTPLKERAEWVARLAQLSSVLQTKQAAGGTFTASTKVTYSWKDITEITPAGLSYMTDRGVGKISLNELPPDLANQLGLSSGEADKWSSEEAQRQQTVDQVVADNRKAQNDRDAAIARQEEAQTRQKQIALQEANDQAVLRRQQAIDEQFAMQQNQQSTAAQAPAEQPQAATPTVPQQPSYEDRVKAQKEADILSQKQYQPGVMDGNTGYGNTGN